LVLLNLVSRDVQDTNIPGDVPVPNAIRTRRIAAIALEHDAVGDKKG
jgi:hypothetical protein